jgi:hypothetical protein
MSLIAFEIQKWEDSKDPWVETQDAFGRTRIIRQSQMAAFQGFEKGGTEGDNNSTQREETSSDMHGSRSGLGMMTDDMRREAEREQWEAQARREGKVSTLRH